jgi:hypothetical protein
MIKYLVVGLEASCTRVVSKLIAVNSGIIKSQEEWDGHDEILNDQYSVTHRSMPHGRILSESEPRNSFIDIDYAKGFDYVIFVSRDWHCSLASKVRVQQPSKKNAINEHWNGIYKIKDLLNNLDNTYLFSYETAFLFQESYLKLFLKSINLETNYMIKIEDVNEKYFNLNKLVLEYLKDQI